MKYSFTELQEFIDSKKLQFDRIDSPLDSYSYVSEGIENINFADPFEVSMFNEALLMVNGEL